MNFDNRILLAALVAWCSSQLLKTIIHLIIHHKIVWERLVGDGGMPSSHSAVVTAAATAAAFRCGLDSPVFAVAAILAMIVMHDARGVRQETGKQAKVINSMLELLASMDKGDLTPEETLKEFVGHTGRQVFFGALLGFAIGVLIH